MWWDGMKPGGIAFSCRAARIRAKDTIGAFIPSHHIHSFVEESGRVDEAIKNALSSGVWCVQNLFMFFQCWNWPMCQEKQMTAFLCVKLQNGCQALQHLVRHLNIPALLKPGIPGNAYTNQLSKLFSSETTCSSPLKCWEGKLFMVQ